MKAGTLINVPCLLCGEDHFKIVMMTVILYVTHQTLKKKGNEKKNRTRERKKDAHKKAVIVVVGGRVNTVKLEKHINSSMELRGLG